MYLFFVHDVIFNVGRIMISNPLLKIITIQCRLCSGVFTNFLSHRGSNRFIKCSFLWTKSISQKVRHANQGPESHLHKRF